MKLLYCLLSCVVVFASCTKSQEDQRLTPSSPVTRIEIAPGMFVQKKGEEFFIAAYYVKDQTEQDKVELTVGEVSGIKVSEREQGVGDKLVLFKFPSFSVAGQVNIKLKIINGKVLAEKDHVFRFVDDYSVKNIWENMSKEYLSVFRARFTIIESKAYVDGFGYNEPLMALGYYALEDGEIAITNKAVLKKFIPGLTGRYSASFINGTLQNIRVEHGKIGFTQGYDIQQTENQLTAVYGLPISKTTSQDRSTNTIRYSTGNYFIDLTERFGDVYSLIIKK